jgi:YD repeat-containing protein
MKKGMMLGCVVLVVCVSLTALWAQTTPNWVYTRVYQEAGNESRALKSYEYSDGLGRALQTKTMLNASVGPGINAIASATLFDDAGRPKIALKPFATNTGAQFLADDASDIGTQLGIYLFSENAYYDDPLSRVRERSGPGYKFRIESPLSSTNHTARYWYFGVDTNDFENDSRIEGGFLKPSGFGDVNTSTKSLDRQTILTFLDSIPSAFGTNPQHFLTVTLDENNNVSQTLKDVFGKTVKTWSKKGGADKMVSSYSYDILGNLISESPPYDGVYNPLMPTAYTYNTLGQMLTKTLPGTGSLADSISESYEYDIAGRVVKINRLKKNVVLETINIEYDDFGRIISKCKEGSSTSDIEFFYDGYIGMSQARWGVLNDYLSKCSMSGSEKDALLADISSDDNGRSRLTAAFAFNKLPTAHGIIVRVVADLYVYDDFGRIARQYKSVPSVSLKKTCFGYDFSDRVVVDTVYNAFTNMSVFAYTYDANGRLSGIYDSLSLSRLLVEYSYDDLGKLTAKRFTKYKDPSIKRAIEYAYNSRDWLTSIESGTPDGYNYFKEEVFYDSSQTVGGSASIPQYNGNISLAKYYYGESNPLALRYSYDLLNRLDSTQAVEVPVPGRTALPFPDSAYNEQFSHDDLGRIESKYVGRYGNPVSSTRAYSYYTNSARLAKVSSQPGVANYFYDYFGNMIYDFSKHMAITYDWRNMPIKFTFYTGDPNLSAYTGAAANGTLNKEDLAQAVQTANITVVSEVYMLYDANGNRVIKMEKKL